MEPKQTGAVYMHMNSLIKRLLRIEKIVVEDVRFEDLDDEETLIIQVRSLSRDAHRCPLCDKRRPGYDLTSKKRR